MTFSVAGICPDTGMVGCVITSSSICVASRCAYTRDDVGVALTQNVTNPLLGPLALDLLEQGQTPANILPLLSNADTNIQYRQLGLLAANGEAMTFSGSEALGIHATATGKNCLALGNLLANDTIPAAMVAAFEAAEGPLAERLLTALEAGLAAGGEMGPLHSAGLKVSAASGWPVVDLRVDWHIAPLTELRMIWQAYKPQLNDYVTRAVQPDAAASFGVPGDE
ncbi:DUF1028 domain-containing protein [Oceanobacter mangrovi]|uniref:DUF1028 domain-containing protein n=1 Tax=Oceanobacter mangrovi TaxID=2862510 RepID=UPI001C8EE279